MDNNRIKSLTLDYFREWDKDGRKSITIRNKIAVLNEKLVGKAAHSISNTTVVPVNDLYNEGYLALIRAIERFNPSEGSFSTFAIRYIQGGIQRYLRDNDGPLIRPTRSVYDEVSGINRVSKRTGWEPTKIARARGHSSFEWQSMQAATKRSNTGAFNTEGEEYLPSKVMTPMEASLKSEEQLAQRKALATTLEGLDKRAVNILMYLYLGNMTEKHIAQLYGIKLKEVKEIVRASLSQIRGSV